jgi:tetratricopeptide (TPR) repeat protein
LKEMLLIEGAKEFQSRALQVAAEIQPMPVVTVAKINFYLAQLYWNLGDFDSAKPHINTAIQLFEEKYGKDHIKIGKCLTGLGGKEKEKLQEELSCFAEFLTHSLCPFRNGD